MCEISKDANDLGNIDLSDETRNDNDNDIILFECKDDDVSQSIFGILALPELD